MKKDIWIAEAIGQQKNNLTREEIATKILFALEGQRFNSWYENKFGKYLTVGDEYNTPTKEDILDDIIFIFRLEEK